MNAHQDEHLTEQRPAQPPDKYTARDDVALLRADGAPQLGVADVVRMQRTVGNTAVARLLGPRTPIAARVQRQGPADGAGLPPDVGAAPGPAEGAGAGGIPAAAQALVGTEFPMPVSSPDPLPVPGTAGMGDFPLPGENGGGVAPGGSGGPLGPPPTAMALHDESVPLPARRGPGVPSAPATVQRDDNSPHLSGDVAGQGQGTVAQTPHTPAAAPVTIDVSLIYRNLDLWHSASGNWEVVHEPQIQVIGDSGLSLSVQEAITLVNLHWMPPWKRELEFGLSAFAQQTLLPAFGTSYGAQLQAEQHLAPWFSLTATITGSYAPPMGSDTTGVLSGTVGAGFLIHFDGFGGGH